MLGVVLLARFPYRLQLFRPGCYSCRPQGHRHECLSLLYLGQDISWVQNWTKAFSVWPINHAILLESLSCLDEECHANKAAKAAKVLALLWPNASQSKDQTEHRTFLGSQFCNCDAAITRHTPNQSARSPRSGSGESEEDLVLSTSERSVHQAMDKSESGCAIEESNLSSSVSEGGKHTESGTAAGTEPILSITDDDVALGRGKHLYSHTGNVKFRKIVAEFARKYMENESRTFRKATAQKIIDKVKKSGGRFLQPFQVEGEGGAMETHWKGVSTSFVNSKVTQALRDTANSLQPAQPQRQLERFNQMRRQSVRRIAPSNYTVLAPAAVQDRHLVQQSSAIARQIPGIQHRSIPQSPAEPLHRNLHDINQPHLQALNARLLLQDIQRERERERLAAAVRAREQLRTRLLSTPSGRLMLSGVSPRALISARLNERLRGSAMLERKEL